MVPGRDTILTGDSEMPRGIADDADSNSDFSGRPKPIERQNGDNERRLEGTRMVIGSFLDCVTAGLEFADNSKPQEIV